MFRPKRSIFAEVKERFGDEQLPLYLCFSAPWCDTCVEQKPLIQNLEPEFENRVKFVKVDIDEHPDFKDAAGVKAIPAHVIISSDKSRGGISIGYLDEDALRSFISKASTI